jgi:hypothetical protein
MKTEQYLHEMDPMGVRLSAMGAGGILVCILLILVVVLVAGRR